MLYCMPRTTYFVKTLRLVTPGIANSLGIPAEAPIFLSPAIDMPRFCGTCRRTYSPLVYQTGQVTVAQHYHDIGGIYCYVTTSLRIIARLAAMSGFIATLEPIGQLRIERVGGDRYGRAEAVRTKAIAVYCQHRATCIRGLLTRPCDLIELQEGMLVEHPSPIAPRCRFTRDCKEGSLFPLCDAEELEERERGAFHFQVRDSTLYFSIR
jgi:hypothetical protein